MIRTRTIAYFLRIPIWGFIPGFLLSGCIVAQTSTDTQLEPVPAYTVTTVENQAVSTAIDASAQPVEPLYSAADLQQLVGPYALYPDELLAIVLPAATYPLEIVLAARFLQELEDDASLQPDETWDESVVALLNYPEVLQLMNDNIEATWQLGEAVIAQQADVLTAIESFRQLALDAGNLQSDDNQNVVVNENVIEIHTVEEKVVYVPQYIVEEVIVEQPVPVYHYYPTPRPVYYYPYPAGYRFRAGYFWGVTTAFSIGWPDYHLRVYHPTYRYHPYYGRRYFNDYHYRRPTINVFNSYYVNNSYRLSRDRHRYGSYWRPQRHSAARPFDSRYNRYYADDRSRNRLSEGRRNRGSYGDLRGQGGRSNRATPVGENNPFTALRDGSRNDVRGGGRAGGRGVDQRGAAGTRRDGGSGRQGQAVGVERLRGLREGTASAGGRDRSSAAGAERLRGGRDAAAVTANGRGNGADSGRRASTALSAANRAGDDVRATRRDRGNLSNLVDQNGRAARSRPDTAAGAARSDLSAAVSRGVDAGRADRARGTASPGRLRSSGTSDGSSSLVNSNADRSTTTAGSRRTNVTPGSSRRISVPNGDRSATNSGSRRSNISLNSSGRRIVTNRSRGSATVNSSGRSNADQSRRQSRDVVTRAPRQQTQIRRAPAGSNRSSTSNTRNQRLSPAPSRSASANQQRRQQAPSSNSRRSSIGSTSNRASVSRSQRNSSVQQQRRQPSVSARRPSSAGSSRPSASSNRSSSRSAISAPRQQQSVRGGSRRDRRGGVREN